MGIDLAGAAKDLFDEVCKLIGQDNGWPPDEPADARALGAAWSRVATIIDGAVDNTNRTADTIFGNWPDTAGYEFHKVVKGFNGDLGAITGSCRELAAFCEQYAQDVEQQRMATRIEMIINAASFALALTGAGGVASMFVRTVANQVLKRTLLAVGRTAVTAQTRSRAATIALNTGKIALNLTKEVSVEALEETVISAGSQLTTHGNLDLGQVGTDALAGGIGGALGYAPGKVIGMAKPKTFVGQHTSALVGGAGLNAVTSPVSSQAAQDIVNGEFSGLDAYGTAISENAGDAARMGAVRANGTVLAGQANQGIRSLMSPDSVNIGTPPTGPDISPTGPDGPPNTDVPASSGATAGEGGTSGAQGTSEVQNSGNQNQTGTQTGSEGGTRGGTQTGTEGGTRGSTQTGTEGGTRTGSESGARGGNPAESGSRTGSQPGSESGARGNNPTGTESGIQSETETGVQTGNEGGTRTGTESGTQQGTEGGAQTGNEGGTRTGGEGGAQGGNQQGSPESAGANAPGGVSQESVTTSTGTEQTESGAAILPGTTAGTTTPGARAQTPAAPGKAATENRQEPVGEASTEATEQAEAAPDRPAEINETIWAELARPVRDAVAALFTPSTSQATKNALAKLLEVGLPSTVEQTVVELAATLRPTIVETLTGIAQLSPSPEVLDAAIAFAAEGTLRGNDNVRAIHSLLRSGPPTLDAELRALGVHLTGAPVQEAGPGRRPPPTPSMRVYGQPTDPESGVIAPLDDTPPATPEPSGVDVESGVIAPPDESAAQEPERSEPQAPAPPADETGADQPGVAVESGVIGAPERTSAPEPDQSGVGVGSGVIAPPDQTSAPEQNSAPESEQTAVPEPDQSGVDVGSGVIAPPDQTGDPEQNGAPESEESVVDPESGVIGEHVTEQAPESTPPGRITQPLADTYHRDNAAHAQAVEQIANAALREADHRAGMASVTPPPPGGTVHQITPQSGVAFAASVQVADLGSTVAASYTVEGDTVRVTVSSRASVDQVPSLVAAALGEAVAQRSGVDADLADRLTEGSSGGPTLSRRDHGRAAQLLDHARTLDRRPHSLRTRSRLKALIRDMGLDPSQDGAAGRLSALPDERMREVVRQYTRDPDGLLGTTTYLAKNVITALPVPVALGVVAFVFGAMPVPGLVAVTSVALARAVAQGLYDRSLAQRDQTAGDNQLAGRKRQLAEQSKTAVAEGFLQVVAQLRYTGEGVLARADTPGADPIGPDAVTMQVERVLGLRRGAGAIAATTALGVVLAVSALTPLGAVGGLATAGILVGTLAPTVVGTIADSIKKRYTLSWKADRTNAVLTKVDAQVRADRDEIFDLTGTVLDGVTYHLPSGATRTGSPATADNKQFAYSDDAPNHLARAALPQSAEATRKDRDPTALAQALSLEQEQAVFRVASAVVAVAVNLATGGRKAVADQRAGEARRTYDEQRKGDREIASIAEALAAVLSTTAPALSEMDPTADTPLADDPNRPSPRSSRKWLAVGVASGLLMVGIAAGLELTLGLSYLAAMTAAGSVGAPVDGIAERVMSRKEEKPADLKAELARTLAQSTRDDFVAAMTDFAAHLLGHRNPPQPRQPTGDVDADRILAARDAAFGALVEQATELTGDLDASHTELATTLVDRVVRLREVASQAEKLAALRTGQPRAEVATRNALIAAIQSYNRTPGVTPLPLAELFDGVHAGSGASPVPPLPSLPRDVNGQAAAVLADRHLADPTTPAEVPAGLVGRAGTEGWGARIAAAAGVPGQRFRPVSAINDVVARLTQLGEGSRAIVHAARKDADGVVESGDLINAVNIGGTVYLINPVTGRLADVTAYGDGLTMLVTDDRGERAAQQSPAAAAARAVAARVRDGYVDQVHGRLLTDPAAPGLATPSDPIGLPDTVVRIASVINPTPGGEMANYHAFSDQWDHHGEPPPVPGTDPVAGIATARAVAALAAAVITTFGDDELTGLPEYRNLETLLRQEDVPTAALFDAMTELMEALGSSAP